MAVAVLHDALFPFAEGGWEPLFARSGRLGRLSGGAAAGRSKADGPDHSLLLLLHQLLLMQLLEIVGLLLRLQLRLILLLLLGQIRVAIVTARGRLLRLLLPILLSHRKFLSVLRLTHLPLLPTPIRPLPKPFPENLPQTIPLKPLYLDLIVIDKRGGVSVVGVRGKMSGGLSLLEREIARLLEAGWAEKKGGAEKKGVPEEVLKRIDCLLREYQRGGSEDWRKYALIDESRCYTRNLISEREGLFSIILLCWNPAKCSPCHDHNGSQCFMLLLEGSLVETRYKTRDTTKQIQTICPQTTSSKTSPASIPTAGLAEGCPLSTAKGSPSLPAADESKTLSGADSLLGSGLGLELMAVAEMRLGDVAFINDGIGVHAVRNGSETERACSLHVYIPPYRSCRCWGAGAERTTSHITFHSVAARLS